MEMGMLYWGELMDQMSQFTSSSKIFEVHNFIVGKTCNFRFQVQDGERLVD